MANDKKRIHMSQKPMTLEQKKYTQKKGPKPWGFWYAIGQEWVEWVKFEMPQWHGQYNYDVNLGSANLLIIENSCELENFHKEYASGEFSSVNWSSVAEKYDGIEIDPYQWKYRHQYFWYYGWDVASGCVWNLEKVKIKETT